MHPILSKKTHTLQTTADRLTIHQMNIKDDVGYDTIREIILNKIRYYDKLLNSWKKLKDNIFFMNAWEDELLLDIKNDMLDICKKQIRETEGKLSKWEYKYNKIYKSKVKPRQIDIKQRIKEIKASYTMQDILNRHGIEPNRMKKIRCISPQHTDNNPSMHVYENRLYCFACGKSYDVIDAEMELGNKDFITVLTTI